MLVRGDEGMPRLPTGQIITRDNQIYARVRWTDDQGSVRSKERRARSRTHAQAVIRQLQSEIDDESLPAASDITFSQLAEVYLEARVQPAEYSGDRKVSGMRAWKNVESEVRQLRTAFDAFLIVEISYSDLDAYRLERLSTPTIYGRERKLAGLNHELRRLRAMLNFAIQRDWLTVNPFHQGPPLISAADETPRNRPRRDGEEEKLLEQCTGRRAHLRAILIAAIDTGMRHSEILGLERRDVDLERGVITVRAMVTKTQTQRMVPISARLREELELLLARTPPEPDAILFRGIKSVRTAFRAVCSDAKITDLNFHDLRHWATTDLVAAFTEAGLAVQHVMRITGHSQEKTFRRYIRTDDEIVRKGGLALESMRKRKGENSPIQVSKRVKRRKSA